MPASRALRDARSAKAGAVVRQRWQRRSWSNCLEWLLETAARNGCLKRLHGAAADKAWHWPYLQRLLTRRCIGGIYSG
eukprot:364639-Chlamydomonas_euryale.AAC.34